MSFIWIRGLTYLRVFAPVRYLIMMVIEVTKDMMVFLVIVFYCNIAFAFLFLCQKPYDERNFLDEFKNMFQLLTIGAVEPSTYNLTEWITFALATMVAIIIMLNLLISIISDTFDRVQTTAVIANSRACLQLLSEIEGLAFWKRKGSNK